LSKAAPHLLRVELTALLALAACALAFAAFTIFAYLTPDDYVKPVDEMQGQAIILAVYFFCFGLLPVALYGAPIYVALASRGKANWLSVLCVGLIPGILLVFIDRNLGLYGTVAGVAVSLLTHTFCRRLF